MRGLQLLKKQLLSFRIRYVERYPESQAEGYRLGRRMSKLPIHRNPPSLFGALTGQLKPQASKVL